MSKIIGNTTATPNPRPDWAQSDSTKADYIKNKPTLIGVSTPENGEIFNDYENNKAIADYSSASGVNTLAGCKAFVIDTDYYDLYPKYDAGKEGDGIYVLDSVDGLEVGDIYSIETDGNYEFAGEIIAIGDDIALVENGNYLSMGQPFVDAGADSKLLVLVDKFYKPVDMRIEGNLEYYGLQYFRVPSKPLCGTTTMGTAANAEGYQTVAEHIGAHAEGYNTIASGKYSHAEGRGTKAGYAAHAEGWNTEATGHTAHAEGYNTVATGHHAHTEGEETMASAASSHAEGRGTVSSGEASHAEGVQSTASNYAAHAEGSDTVASGGAAHAEGRNTDATGAAAHAEGNQTGASGNASHSEGTNTSAIGDHSHAEGYYTTSSGIYSHAEGRGGEASGEASHKEGKTTTASGYAAHSEGEQTTASGYASHAGGYYTKAQYDYQTVIGKYNKNNENTLFEVGNGTSTANSKRSNAFEVYSDGHAELQTQGTTDNSITQKKYVDDIKQELNSKINTLSSAGLTREIVTEMPNIEDANDYTIYMIQSPSTGLFDSYEEYMVINGKWERIGSSMVDLEDYYSKYEIDEQLSDKMDKFGELKWIAKGGVDFALTSDSTPLENKSYPVVYADENQIVLYNDNGYVVLQPLNTQLNINTGDTLHFKGVADDVFDGCTIYNAKTFSDKMDKIGTVSQEGGTRVINLDGDNSSLTGADIRVGDYNGLGLYGGSVGIHASQYIHLEATSLDAYFERIDVNEATINGISVDDTDDTSAATVGYVNTKTENKQDIIGTISGHDLGLVTLDVSHGADGFSLSHGGYSSIDFYGPEVTINAGQLYLNGWLTLPEQIYTAAGSHIQGDELTITGINVDADDSTSAVNVDYVDNIKQELNSRIDILSSSGLTREIVTELPSVDQANEHVIYMIKASLEDENNIYEEYMIINGQWELIGSSAVDLSGYYTKDEIDTAVSSKADVGHNHDSVYDTKGSANNALESSKTYTDTAVAQKSQVQIITWEADD